MKYVQVRLARNTKEGTQEMVSYVQTHGTNGVKVTKGAVINVDGYQGTWQVVSDVDHTKAVDKSALNAIHKERKNMPSLNGNPSY